jgi:LysM repeat protein
VLGAVLSAVALLAVIVGVPVVLVAIGAVARSVPSPHQLLTSLGNRDESGAYFRIAAGLAVWVAWAVFTAATIKEAGATIRFRGPRPTAPLHGVGRLGPAGLVAAIAILFVAAPAGLALPATHAGAAPAPPASSATTSIAPAPPSVPSRSTPHTDTASNSDQPTYLVQRYDTLWSIAEHHLPGDPAQRYKDIRALNADLVGEDNTIVTGTTLTLPADAYGLSSPPTENTTTEREVTVATGDTLSGLAAQNGISDWHDVWDENRDRAEPQGAHLVNPNHIEPGWTIDIRVPAKSSSKIPPTRATPSTPDPPANTPGPTNQTTSNTPSSPTPRTPAPTVSSLPTTPTSPTTPLPRLSSCTSSRF